MSNKNNICLESIIASMPGYVYWKNTKGEYLGCNNATITLLGLPKNEIIGHDDYYLGGKFGWDISIIHKIREIDEEIIESGAPRFNIEEAPFLDKNGNIIQWITNKAPLCDELGKVIGVIGNSINITQHKKIEEELRQAKIAEEVASEKRLANLASLYREVVGESSTHNGVEEFDVQEYAESIRFYLESIIACMPGNVYWMDTNSIYLGCNDNVVKMLGLRSRAEIIGKTYEEMTNLDWSAGQGKSFRQSDLEVIASGEPKLNVEEPPLQDANGNTIHFLTSRVPIKNKSNQVLGVVGISIDITERKQMEEKLRQAKSVAEAANQAKTEFIANMSHDIRTPLTGVIGLSEILENTLDDPKQKEEAHLLYDSGKELLNMLNGILDDVQAGNVSHNLHRETFNLHQCIDDLVKLEKPTTTLKNLGLHVKFDPSVPNWIVSDRKKIQRIILNLLGNAIKFTNEGHITVAVNCLQKKGKKVHLQFGVSDTGIGIPEKLQKKVFDRFFKVSSSNKGLYKGHGLGLDIVQSYVRLLGGNVSLTSEEGVGTTFHFDFHCKIGCDQEIQKQVLSKKMQDDMFVMSESPKNGNGNAPTLLLVEDNNTALRVLESLVVKAGCQFHSASSGEEALEIFQSHTFDLIITDIGLPGISGDELAFKIREWEKSHSKPMVPIIGLTGHVQESEQENFLRAGMTLILQKPTNAVVIQQTVKKFILDPKKDSPSTASKPLIGKDLPQCEEELFVLENFPLFDEQHAMEQLNDVTLLKELIRDFISSIAQKDLHDLQQAYDDKNWEDIEKIAHRLKGGAVYIGTCRMQYACQYLERYHKAGFTDCLDKLYRQLLDVNEKTLKVLTDWVNKDL